MRCYVTAAFNGGLKGSCEYVCPGIKRLRFERKKLVSDVITQQRK